MSEKNYLTINEIAGKTGIAPHTIRYWESRFKLLRPLRLASGHRRYTQKDLETVNEIKDLVLLKGYSLRGARKALYARGKSKPEKKQSFIPPASDAKTMELLEEIKKELRQIMKDL
ncbi:MAG TPA: MerR family transcriptional regulator [Elusimicrobia bacterium]|jgi:DNA-binding transcriptional MerR regulator|nr:MerR family transcriptional regulator [Elusimicrobiota bacterium]